MTGSTVESAPRSSDARRLLAVRHAPTSSSGLCVGDAEIACTVSADEAARQILSLLGDARFACVWTSPRERCQAPARLVAQSLGLPLRIDGRVREISLGEWQLRQWDDIAAVDGERLRAWMDDWLDRAPPGGERPAQLLERVSSWWNDLASGDHLLVSHAGVHRALRVLLGRLSFTEAMNRDVPHLEGEWFHTR